jgi:hypothetical protein
MRWDRERIAEDATVTVPQDRVTPRPDGVRFALGMVCGLLLAIPFWALLIAFLF